MGNSIRSAYAKRSRSSAVHRRYGAGVTNPHGESRRPPARTSPTTCSRWPRRRRDGRPRRPLDVIARTAGPPPRRRRRRLCPILAVGASTPRQRDPRRRVRTGPVPRRSPSRREFSDRWVLVPTGPLRWCPAQVVSRVAIVVAAAIGAIAPGCASSDHSAEVAELEARIDAAQEELERLQSTTSTAPTKPTQRTDHNRAASDDRGTPADDTCDHGGATDHESTDGDRARWRQLRPDGDRR